MPPCTVVRRVQEQLCERAGAGRQPGEGLARRVSGNRRPGHPGRRRAGREEDRPSHERLVSPLRTSPAVQGCQPGPGPLCLRAVLLGRACLHQWRGRHGGSPFAPLASLDVHGGEGIRAPDDAREAHGLQAPVQDQGLRRAQRERLQDGRHRGTAELQAPLAVAPRHGLQQLRHGAAPGRELRGRGRGVPPPPPGVRAEEQQQHRDREGVCDCRLKEWWLPEDGILGVGVSALRQKLEHQQCIPICTGLVKRRLRPLQAVCT
mmetsp:Transcript_102305/g.305479  ORF Transcript_102305/g.305479 Transcript_102305/m.305479 type:complete len:262 (-) Transcript_102305:110-895(-)